MSDKSDINNWVDLFEAVPTTNAVVWSVAVNQLAVESAARGVNPYALGKELRKRPSMAKMLDTALVPPAVKEVGTSNIATYLSSESDRWEHAQGKFGSKVVIDYRLNGLFERLSARLLTVNEEANVLVLHAQRSKFCPMGMTFFPMAAVYRGVSY